MSIKQKSSVSLCLQRLAQLSQTDWFHFHCVSEQQSSTGQCDISFINKSAVVSYLDSSTAECAQTARHFTGGATVHTGLHNGHQVTTAPASPRLTSETETTG